ncbi:MAG: hypothetical protein A4E64_02415 [Syntrophorhabdus sp. PtaU1.Bin058]|nr:MAG: hypothetical protein A4E64_02415 [Syntrophorhabdus sp. PtaU1.Bin058]
MPVALKKKDDNIKIKEYITDHRGHKIAAVIDIAELNRIRKVLKTIPPSEIWLYKNEEAIGCVQEGLRDAKKGNISKLNLKDI